ncbi:MAG: FprA family A-type flavoprotein [Planctomycetota bacterium]|jgi:flavorubredoxin
MNTPLREGIDWVGYLDWTVRDFHSYDTQRGTTYNAYLVRDEKTALIDTVKAPYADRLLRNVAALAEPAAVDYVICNHAEPDHAGALPSVMRALPGATLVCSKKCLGTLSQYHDTSPWEIRLVADGERLSLGSRTLHFVETPMVHWPESMFTYVPEEKLLFSMDAFGQHLATSQRFDDEVFPCTLMEEAKAYYANIVMPFGKPVAACLEKASSLQIEMIAPSHGLIWRSRAAEILNAYRNWCVCRPKPKVLVVYDSMWESTAAMAGEILEGASLPGVETELIHVRRSNLTRIATEVIDAAGVAFGSSTLNRDMMPAAAAVLSYLHGLRPVDKAGFAFGSYGWSPGGPKAVDAALRAMKWEILREPITAQYRPTPEILGECAAAGKMLAEKAKQMAADRSPR